MPFAFQPVLKSDVIELRPLRADDFDSLYAVASDPLIWEQHPDNNRHEIPVFRQFFQDALKSGGALVAIDPKTGKVIGSSRYHGYSEQRSEVEIGWTFLARAYWGGHYNGAMKQLMLQHAFQFVDSVVFLIGPNNLRSQRAVEKIGARRVGMRANQNGRESVVYQITANEHTRLNHYAIRGGREGKQRLRVLSKVLRPTTIELLKKAGLREGMSCADLGCGGGDVTFDMADLVGSKGAVVGIDLDETILQLDEQELLNSGRDHVRFRQFDATKLEDDSLYHLMYARFLLTHLHSPDLVLEKMVSSVKPGGCVVAEDIQFSGHFSHPDSPAFQKYVAMYQQAVRRKGGDPEIGPRLPGLFHNAGLREIQFAVIQPVFMVGEGKQMALNTLDNIKPVLISEGIAARDEIEITLQELHKFISDPSTLVSMPRIFQVWGYRK